MGLEFTLTVLQGATLERFPGLLHAADTTGYLFDAALLSWDNYLLLILLVFSSL